MKTIGKVAVLAMTLSLAVVLSACGGNTSSSASASSASASASAAASSAAAASTSASAASSASAAASSASASSTALSEANVYTNEAFGLEYVLPEGWSFIDAATLAKTNQVISSMASNDAVDMVASSADGATAIIVAITQPSAETSGKSAKEFLDAQVKELEAGLKNDITYETTEAEVTFDGITRTLPAAFTTMKLGDATIVLGQAVAEKDGSFLDVVATGTNEADVQNAFTAFRAATA